MRREIVSTLIVVALIVGAGIGYFANTTSKTTQTVTYTESNTSTEETTSIVTLPIAEQNSTNSSSYNETGVSTVFCVVLVEGNGVDLRIADSSNHSLGGLTVYAVPKANSCLGEPPFPTPFEQTSNATGWVALNSPNIQANYYYQVTVLDYGGKNYSLVLPQWPLETTLANLSLPSGNLTVQHCQTLYEPTRFSCNPFVNSTSTSSTTP